jgi:hypothetical protein
MPTSWPHFRDWLKEEGLPGNERVTTVRIPMNVTYDVGKRLKVLRPRMKKGEERDLSFSKDGPVIKLGEIPGQAEAEPGGKRLVSAHRFGEQSTRCRCTVDKKEGRLEADSTWLGWIWMRSTGNWNATSATSAGTT